MILGFQVPVRYFGKYSMDLTLTLLHSKFQYLSKKLLSNIWSASSLLFPQPHHFSNPGEEFGCSNGSICVWTYMNIYFNLTSVEPCCLLRCFPIRLQQSLTVVRIKDSEGNLQAVCAVCIQKTLVLLFSTRLLPGCFSPRYFSPRQNYTCLHRQDRMKQFITFSQEFFSPLFSTIQPSENAAKCGFLLPAKAQ